MKKFIFSALFAAACATQALAQQPIPAKQANKHVGQQITVVDSVYSIKSYNDSTAVIELGGKGQSTPLNIVFKLTPDAKLNAQFIKNCKQAKLAVTGNIVSVVEQPTMVVTDKSNIHFFLPAAHKQWMTFAQLVNRN